MGKLNKQVKLNEQILTESKTLREEYINSADFDILDKIKSIKYLTDDMILGIEQIADYYEVSNNTVKTIIKRSRDEFEEDGMKVLVGEELRDFKDLVNSGSNETELIGNKVASYTILNKRAMMRIGMLMTNCAMATMIRNYLLNIEQISTIEQKDWAIQREAGKIDRKRMTSAISKYITDSPNKRFAYPNYTNMIYRILFNGKDAKQLRIERNVKDNYVLRDSFIGEELKSVDEAETIVTALVTLGFSYDYIKEQLEKKYIKMIN